MTTLGQRTRLGLGHVPSPVAKPEGPLMDSPTGIQGRGRGVPIKQRRVQLPEGSGLAGQPDAIAVDVS